MAFVHFMWLNVSDVLSGFTEIMENVSTFWAYNQQSVFMAIAGLLPIAIMVKAYQLLPLT